MTLVFQIRTYITNPGYLPKWLKTPLNQNGMVPEQLVRIYNARFWIANRIYMFDEFIAPAAEDEGLIQIADNTNMTTDEDTNTTQHSSNSGEPREDIEM